MSAYESLFIGLGPGETMTIKEAAKKYRVSYGQAQRALYRLWWAEVLTRHREGRVLVYEGKQGRLL